MRTSALTLASDPNATPFYAATGRCGYVRSRHHVLVGPYRSSGSACRTSLRMKVHDEQVIQAERCRVAYSADIASTKKLIN
jgi:hypothetical protein